METSLQAPPAALRTDTVGEKAAVFLAEAEQAFARQEYSAALSAIEHIPETQRSREVESLRSRCVSLRKSQQACESAARAFAAGNYDEAVQLLERVPADARTPEGSALLEEARTMAVLGPILLAARDALSNRHYAYAVEVLESVLPEQRSQEHLELLAQAHLMVRRVREIRDEAEQHRQRAIAERDKSSAVQAVALLEELVSLTRPEDSAAERLAEARELPGQLDELAVRLERAREAFESRDYECTIERLDGIASVLRDQEIEDLQSEAELCRARIGELVALIREQFESRAFGVLSARIAELGELVADPIALAFDTIPAADVLEALGDLAQVCGDDAQLLDLIETLVGHIDAAEFVTFLPRRGQKLLDHYPPGGQALPEQLVEILNSLVKSGSGFDEKLEALQFARGHLGQAEEHLLNWERCLALLAEFDEIQRRAWSFREMFIENEHSRRLDETARRFAEAASRVIPLGHDAWESLIEVFGSHLEERAFVVRRAYAKIRHFLKTGAWLKAPVTIVTLRRAMTTAFAIVLLTILGAVVETVMASLFQVGGISGYALVFSLAGLWTFFYVEANRIL
jgi:hypothetical protein